MFLIIIRTIKLLLLYIQIVLLSFWNEYVHYSFFSSDGEWSVWSDYSVCSCQPQVDIGTKSKTRTCNMPAEENGGDFCIPLENNAVDNSSGTQIESQTDPCPCPVSK